MRIHLWMAALAAVLFSGCSSVVVLNPKEFKAELDKQNSVLLSKMDSGALQTARLLVDVQNLRLQVDSLCLTMLAQGIRSKADAGDLTLQVSRHTERLDSRLQEVDAALQKLEERVSKAGSRAARRADNPDTTAKAVVAPVDSVRKAQLAEFEPVYARAKTLYQSAKYKEAYKAYRDLSEKDTTFFLFREQNLVGMAQCLELLDKKPDALVYVEEVLRLYPTGEKSCQVWAQKARLYTAMSKKDSAQAALRALLSAPHCQGTNEAALAREQVK